MSKEICISTTPHETRLAILENDELTEIYYERENEYTLAGSIYKGRVTRVLPGMQSAFVDVGLERDAFLYVTDFLEEQEEGADFEIANGNGQKNRRESSREGVQENYARSRQPEGGTETKPEADAAGESQESDSPSGTRRWRGRRGRRRGFRSRGQHEESSQLESPAAIEESVEAEPVVMPEHGVPGGMQATNRILLPGESLSKYRGAPAAEAKAEAGVQVAPDAGRAKVNYTAPKPSTLIEAPLDWDGGVMMPGESLSRYRDRAPQQAVEPMADTTAVETEVESHAPETAALTADEPQTSVHQGWVGPYEHILERAVEPAEVTAGGWGASGLVPTEAREEPAVNAEREPPAQAIAVSEAPTGSAEEEIHEEVHEFDPETASASHRVDPSAPSEFRVSSAVEEETPVAPEDLETITEEIREQATLDDHSAEDTVDYADEPAAPQVAEVADQLFGFAPGSGVLEEEVIEEEEYDFEPIHRHGEEHDSEDLEEETLDHAGELSEMVRDSHLEQRLHGGPALDEAEEEESDSEEVETEEEDDPETSFKPEETEEREPEMAVVQPARPRRDGDRRGGRRGERRGDRRGHGGPRRHSAQTMDLPIISDLLKQGQEILVQIAKEPIAKKGARITSHIALPGRFLVFMPTVNHVGVSRKISSDEERQRLKRILISEKGDASGGFIVRTAADGASEDELRADLRFLISLWNDIKQRADSSKAPALIYHDLNLVERVLRDQVSDNFSAIWVDNEMEYERTVRFLNRFQPSLVRRVKLYTKETPLFEQFGIQEEITKALKSKVWLKSGGSIVINQTEALVAIDINTGKYVGKTARLEDTILKTNLDAIPEIVRQIRLRDLGGIIVIDFIDMDERRNRQRVMQALEEELRNDRAPSKTLQFNDFGLVAITRKRVKQSLERTIGAPCPYCQSTGYVKSVTTICNEIYVEMRKIAKHLEHEDVLLRVHPDVAKELKSNNAKLLNEMEEMTKRTIIVKSDPAVHQEQFDIN